MTQRKILAYKGCNLSCRIDGTGSPVLLIQGTGVHGDGWLPQIEHLSSDYECLTFDNRGMGASRPQGIDLTVEQMAEDASALINAQNWHSAHVIGHSLGGLIAIHLALTSPEKVRSLALLCTFARGRDATRLTPQMLWTGIRTRVGSRRQRRRAFLEMVLTPDELAAAKVDAVAEDLARYFGHDLADTPAIVFPQLRAMRKYDATPRLRELKGIPTTVVSAEFDRIARVSSGRAMGAAIPEAKYIEVAAAAHGLPLSQPDRMNELLTAHLQRSS